MATAMYWWGGFLAELCMDGQGIPLFGRLLRVVAHPGMDTYRNLPDDRVGYALSSAGDVNGDGYSDVAVGAYMYNSGQGRA